MGGCLPCPDAARQVRCVKIVARTVPSEKASRTFTVRFKSGDTQPVVAASYIADGDALIFLSESKELVALFDLTEIAEWNPRLPEVADV